MKQNWNPRDVRLGMEEEKTHLVIADLDMLRKGVIFMGTFHSNMARLVHYLRYPHYQNSYSILPSLEDIASVNYFYRTRK